MSGLTERDPAHSRKPASEAVSPALVLEHVSMQYTVGTATVTALDGITLSIWPGTLTVLMGPSGSGKTTLLSIVGGILRPTAGRAFIGNRDLVALSEVERCKIRLRQVGYVFQSYHLFPTLTARRNVEIALELQGVRGRSRRVQALTLLEELGLGDKAEAYPSDLSGGQKQRVAVARALAGSPQIILADEPTAALDSANGRGIIKAFRDLAVRQRRTVLIVTHDNRIIDLADRTIRMEDGRITSDTMADAKGRAAASERKLTVIENLMSRPSSQEKVWLQ